MAVIYYKKGSNEFISPNFRAREFDCPCDKCKQTPIDVDFVRTVLQPIREKANRPMYVNAYRCPDHNKEVKNASPTSLHMEGRAFDCQIPGYPSIEIAKQGEKLGAGGIGYYEKDDFVHLDSGKKRKWLGHEQTPWDTFLSEEEIKCQKMISEIEAVLAKYK